MIDSFWKPLSQAEDPDRDFSSPASLSAHDTLTLTVQHDLESRYGELMGRRQLSSCLLGAFEDSELVGMVGVDVTLVEEGQSILYTREVAETKLKNAIASLGPKQRREYKDASVMDIVQALLPNCKAVVVLSNLAVGMNHRRKGVGKLLCQEVERLADQEWDMNELYLRVESQNDAARKLYESVLGYREAWTEAEAVALRGNWDTGNFEERNCETLSLVKSL